jgi:uncharacterized protein (TIGR00375 family)
MAEEKEVIADLHIHSRFSRATSKSLNIPNLVKYARIKGVDLLGTGDASHDEWLVEVRADLKGKDGIYWYSDSEGEFPFILSGEISLIFSQGGKGRRVHLVYLVPNLEVNKKINDYLSSKGRRDYDGRPIFGISCEEFVKELKKIDDMIEIIPAHVWTPWFGVLGSKGGFKSLKEAFGSQVDQIHAIETGLSSDPEMNWRVKELLGKSIISFSDLHSFWPWRMGREATIFTLVGDKGLSYKGIIKQIRENSFKATIETDPAYGKYHWDGHRNCNFSCPPSKTKELEGKCPKCGKQLIIGVESQVEDLADGPSGMMPPGAKPFYKLLPLHELISFYLGSNVNSKKVWALYNEILEKFKTEYNVLLKVDKQDLISALNNHEKLVKLIIDNRVANIKVQPGYDGEYGKIIDKETQETLY